MRPIEELRNVIDPAWPEIEEAIGHADQPVEVLPSDAARCEATLLQLQVTARSALGALALNTGGLLVDHAWLRILGGGEPPLNLASANGLEQPPNEPPRKLLIAFDVLGGKYAINGGALPGSPGEVCYFAPDELAWWPMEMGLHAFVLWSLTDRLEQFSSNLRWPGWEEEAAALTLDHGISVFPFPFTAEVHDMAKVSRRPVQIAELLTLWEHLANQVKGTPKAASSRFGRRTPDNQGHSFPRCV